MITSQTRLKDLYALPEFASFGRRLLPLDLDLPDHLTLAQVSQRLPWYTHVKVERTVSVLEELRQRARQGETVFYELYSAQEQALDPSKQRTGLVYFKGRPQAKTALVSAGGGFQYVAGIHDSFPHCQALAARGYHAFALIYRPGARTGRQDLARAIALLFQKAEELELDMTDYALWGGSAGARLAIWLGNEGSAAYGEGDYPRPGLVVAAYTGLSQVTGKEPATLALVGRDDWIADAQVVTARIQSLQAHGIPAQVKVYPGLGHGFGLGEGTLAEGWLEEAVSFWEQVSKKEGLKC